MKLSQYFQIIHPKYTYLKLTPDTSIRNYNSTNIAKSIHHIQKNIFQRIHREEKKLTFETPMKCSYLIDIHKTKVEFYFIVPQQYANIAKEKIRETWSKITIEESESVLGFSMDALKYQLCYKKEDALSLGVDKKSNEPLNDILNVIDIMQDADRVSILYNFIPWNMTGWRTEYAKTIAKFKQKQPIEREKLSSKYLFKLVVNLLIEVMDGFMEVVGDFLGNKKKVNEMNYVELAVATMNLDKNLDAATHKKKDDIILKTQAVVISDSADKHRIKQNALSVCQAYKSIEGDNELLYKSLKKDIKVESYTLPAEINHMSINECQNFIQLPGRELLQQFKIINKVDTLESEVPKELQQGTMCLGENTYKGNIQKAYLSNDKEFKNLTLCLIGPTRAGKTTLISNLANDGIKAGETTILFDYCGNAELSRDVAESITKNKVLNIDCSNFDTLQGLGYNEVVPVNDTPFEVYRCAKAKTSQLMTLINYVNDDEEFRARMERVLEAAAVLVFIQEGSIKQVFEMLQNHKLRHKFIDNIPIEQSNNLEEYINTLLEIDEWNKGTKENAPEIIGTKVSYTQGILSRVQKLKQNAYMELMLKKDCSNNINLVEEMQKAQLICIKMPEVMFSTEQEKDIYATYWLTKIWGALQKRKWDIPLKNIVKVNIVIDELYQVPSCQDFLKSKLSQIAKFQAKPIISCHYLGQIQNIRNELKAANCSYMLLSGCDKDNFRELKEELAPYELEDLLNLKRYHSLNLMKYEGGWAKFITKMPAPINN
ncbi:hypothetical protein [Rhodopseudomonas parapalustris]